MIVDYSINCLLNAGLACIRRISFNSVLEGLTRFDSHSCTSATVTPNALAKSSVSARSPA